MTYACRVRDRCRRRDNCLRCGEVKALAVMALLALAVSLTGCATADPFTRGGCAAFSCFN